MAPAIWHPPTLRKDSDEEAERRATWLELFYDLVFVATIGQLAHTLAGEISWPGVGGFVLFFIPIWWCWVGATYYATRFDSDGLFDRLFAFMQIVIVAAMAVHVHHGLDGGDIGFALCYAAFRGLIVLQYIIAGHYNPVAKPLVNHFSIGFSLSIVLWLGSVFVPAPWRYGLWIAGLLLDLGTPLNAGSRLALVPPSLSHVPERVGLFTIIVLGEAILGVIRGLANLEWTLAAEITAVLGLTIAFCLWWLYFDSVDGSPLKSLQQDGNIALAAAWLYAHLPLTAGLAMAGVGLEHLIANGPETPPEAAEQWLFCGAVALALTALAAIHWMTCNLGSPRFRRVLTTYRLGSAVFIVMLALTANLTSLGIVAWTAVACLVQVVFDLFKTRPASSDVAP
ncbi:MAG: low temperature requirement protein A [Tildeniella torsiva UHER 1998/13D]|jgi:low temperature requirement protein LtrA|nr:low temperature requirement protein A [Tildeniella torsiva UHER 1998/13D]